MESTNQSAADSELEILRRVALNVVEAYYSDDLWIDGPCGAEYLRQAHELAEGWARRFRPDFLRSEHGVLVNRR